MTQNPKMTLKGTIDAPPPGRGDGKSRETDSLSERFAWPGRIVLLLVVVLSPWVFASVQYWAQQWITIGLLFGLSFWWFETALNKRSKQVFPFISILVLAGIGIGLLQTTSIPDWVTGIFLGRQPEIYANFTGDPNSSVSISLDRDGTWHQIRLLVIALAGLLLGCRYFRTKRDIVLLMSVVTFNGVVISFFGIIHKLTSNGKMFWFHFVEEGGTPFGPFVNQNNGAGYLLMCLACAIGLLPILMAGRKNKEGAPDIISREIPFWRQIYLHSLRFIAELNAPKVAILFAVIIIAAAIPSTLSRGGVVALLVGSIGTVLMFGMARKPKTSGLVLVPLAGLVIALSAWIGFGDELMVRFDQIDMANVSTADGRIQNWKDTWPAVGEMGILGSGLGSYHDVHRLYRTDTETSLFIYAENQYFQSLVEAGWPGLIVFLIAWLLAFRYAAMALFEGSSPTTIGVGTMGAFLIFAEATTSMFDFGLYIPANMVLMSVLIGFLAYHAQALAVRLKSSSWLQLKTPNYVVQIFILVLIASSTLVAINLHRRATLDSLMQPRSRLFTRENMDITTTVDRIAELSARAHRTPTVESMNYLGELWKHRSRLELYEEMLAEPEVENFLAILEPQDRPKKLDDFWGVTDIMRVQENVYFFRRRSQNEALKFLRKDAIRKRLPEALKYFVFSRRASPIQPLVHLRIGEIKGVISEPREGDADIERALTLAPGNPNFRKIAGIYYLQSGYPLGAVPHFRRFLELEPTHFRLLMNLISGRTSRNMIHVDDLTIAQIIPDDGKMLYEYVVLYMDSDSPLRNQFLARAVKVVEDAPHSLPELNVLLGDIRTEQADFVGAIEDYGRAMISQPNDPKTRLKLAKLLIQVGRLDDATEEVKYLVDHDKANTIYTGLQQEIRKLNREKNGSNE